MLSAISLLSNVSVSQIESTAFEESLAFYALGRYNLDSRKQMLEILLKNGLETSRRDKMLNINLLHKFIMHFVKKDDTDAVDIVKLLIGSGVAFDEVDGFGCNALHLSVSFTQNLELINFFIEKGIDVNSISRSGCFPLHLAADDISVMNLLLSKGADINAKNGRGETVLHAAKRYKYKNVVNYLNENGCNRHR